MQCPQDIHQYYYNTEARNATTKKLGNLTLYGEENASTCVKATFRLIRSVACICAPQGLANLQFCCAATRQATKILGHRRSLPRPLPSTFASLRAWPSNCSACGSRSAVWTAAPRAFGSANVSHFSGSGNTWLSCARC